MEKAMSSTIKDVARYAGVSTATVSRVINNDPNVKPQNAEKVREAIKACNFVPNFVLDTRLYPCCQTTNNQRPAHYQKDFPL